MNINKLFSYGNVSNVNDAKMKKATDTKLHNSGIMQQDTIEFSSRKDVSDSEKQLQAVKKSIAKDVMRPQNASTLSAAKEAVQNGDYAVSSYSVADAMVNFLK